MADDVEVNSQVNGEEETSNGLDSIAQSTVNIYVGAEAAAQGLEHLQTAAANLNNSKIDISHLVPYTGNSSTSYAKSILDAKKNKDNKLLENQVALSVNAAGQYAIPPSLRSPVQYEYEKNREAKIKWQQIDLAAENLDKNNQRLAIPSIMRPIDKELSGSLPQGRENLFSGMSSGYASAMAAKNPIIIYNANQTSDYLKSIIQQKKNDELYELEHQTLAAEVKAGKYATPAIQREKYSSVYGNPSLFSRDASQQLAEAQAETLTRQKALNTWKLIEEAQLGLPNNLKMLAMPPSMRDPISHAGTYPKKSLFSNLNEIDLTPPGLLEEELGSDEISKEETRKGFKEIISSIFEKVKASINNTNLDQNEESSAQKGVNSFFEKYASSYGKSIAGFDRAFVNKQERNFLTSNQDYIGKNKQANNNDLAREYAKAKRSNGRILWEDYLTPELTKGIKRTQFSMEYRGGIQGMAARVGTGLGKSAGLDNLLGLGINAGTLGLGTAATVLIKAGKQLLNAAKYGMQAFGEIESIKTNLGVVFGNKSESSSMFNDISQYAIRSPFGVQQVSEYSVLLKQSGVYASDLLDTMKMIGDTAGGNAEKMRRIANNYAQIVAMGKANTIDLRQFANAGIPIYEELAKQLKVSQKTLRQMTADGKITSDVIEKVFKNMTAEGGVFENATEQGAKTFKARIQNLTDRKQLAGSAFGEYLYNFGDTANSNGFYKTYIDLQESLLSVVQKGFEDINRNKKIEIGSKQEEELNKLETQLTYLEKNNKNGINDEAIKLLQSQINNKRNGISEDDLRGYRNERYLSNTQDLQAKEDDLLNKKAVFDQFNSLFDFSRYNNPKLKDSRNAKLAKILREELVNSGALDHESYDYLGAARSNQKKLDKLYKKDSQYNNLNDLDYIAHLQTLGLIQTRDSYENAEKRMKLPNSSIITNDTITSQWNQTAAYKAQQEAEKSANIAKWQALSKEQKSMGLYDLDKQLQAASEKQQKTGKFSYTNMYKWAQSLTSAQKFTDVLTTSFSNEKQYDFSNDQPFKKDDMQQILGEVNEMKKTFTNFSEIGDVAESILQNKYKDEDPSKVKEKYASEYKKLQSSLRKNISNQLDTLSTSLEKSSSNADVIKAIGVFDKGLSKLFKGASGSVVDILTTAFDSVFVKKDTNVVDEKKIQDLLKEDGKKYVDFWKRYSASTLGISTEGINKGYSVASQYKNLSARSANQAISKALMTSGMSPEQALSYVQWRNPSVYTGKDPKTIGIDQEATAKAYEKFAASADSNAEVTQAYLSQLQNQESQLQEFFSGAAFKTEDLDKLYDPLWAKELGYLNKESFVNAFGAMTDATGHFTEATLKSVSSILEEVQQREANVKVLSSLKNYLKDLQNDTEKTRTINYLTRQTNNGYSKFSGLSEDARSSFYDAIANAYSKSDSLKNRNLYEDIRAYNNGYFDESSLNEKEDALIKRMTTAGIPEENIERYKEGFDVGFYAKDTEAYQAKKDYFDFKKFRDNTPDEILSVIASIFDAANENSKENDISKALANKHPWPRSSIGIKQEDSDYFNMIDFFGQTPSTLNKGNTISQQRALNYFNPDYTGSFEDWYKANLGNDSGAWSNLLSAYREKFGSKHDPLDINDGEKISLDQQMKVAELMGNIAESAEEAKQAVKDMGQSIKDNLKSSLLNGLADTWSKIGEYIAGSDDAAKDLAKSWKQIAINMLESISSAMTNAGFNIAAAGASDVAKGDKSGWGKVAAGLSLAAAGGIAGISAGMLSYEDDDDDNDNDDEAERIQNLKDALSDLIDQAKTDAEYYQKNYLHKQALSANEALSGSNIKVNDAVITPNGNVISTAPDDYLIATKTPDTLMSNENKSNGDVSVEFNPTINVINQTSKDVNAEVQQTTDEDGNVEFDVIIKNVVAEAIADGDMDGAFAQRDYRINGKSVAW